VALQGVDERRGIATQHEPRPADALLPPAAQRQAEAHNRPQRPGLGKAAGQLRVRGQHPCQGCPKVHFVLGHHFSQHAQTHVVAAAAHRKQPHVAGQIVAAEEKLGGAAAGPGHVFVVGPHAGTMVGAVEGRGPQLAAHGGVGPVAADDQLGGDFAAVSGGQAGVAGLDLQGFEAGIFEYFGGRMLAHQC